MDIASSISSARTLAGLTQEELANRAGTSQSAVARLEQGGGNPSIDTVRRLVEAMGFELHLEILAKSVQQDPVVEAYKVDVDRTLIRENLKKSINQRLRDMEAFRKSAVELRAGVRARAKR